MWGDRAVTCGPQTYHNVCSACALGGPGLRMLPGPVPRGCSEPPAPAPTDSQVSHGLSKAKSTHRSNPLPLPEKSSLPGIVSHHSPDVGDIAHIMQSCPAPCIYLSFGFHNRHHGNR